MKITYDYLNKYKTVKGSWTQPQLEAIGVEWPLTKRWKMRIIGKEIDEKADKRFRARLPISAVRKLRKEKQKNNKARVCKQVNHAV